MRKLSAKHRYEVDNKTIIFIPKEWISRDDLEAIQSGEKVTFSAVNENNGNRREIKKGVFDRNSRYIDRSIVTPVDIKILPGGYNVTVELDIDSMPTTRREIDGRR